MTRASERIVKQKGAALIMVLLISAVLGVLVTLTAYQSRMLVMQGGLLKGNLEAERKISNIQAELIYKLTTSSVWLLGPKASRLEAAELPLDLNFFGAPFLYEDVTIQIQDMSGLLSIIPFDENTFKQLLKTNGISEERINIASDSIQDWMDMDDFRRLNGAERSDYNVEGFPRNGYPPSLNELREVQGVDEQIFSIILLNSTLLGSGGIVDQFAPSSILSALKTGETVNSIESLREKQSSLLDEGFYPSRRLRISLSTSGEQGGYSRSFVLVRGMGTREPFFLAEYKFGS